MDARVDDAKLDEIGMNDYRWICGWRETISMVDAWLGEYYMEVRGEMDDMELYGWIAW